MSGKRPRMSGERPRAGGEGQSARSPEWRAPDAGARSKGQRAEEALLPGSEPVEEPGSNPAAGPKNVLCRMCGQPLRDRDSRLWGLGPACRHKLAVRTAPVPPAQEVAQDALPGL
ncbi:DUF6011 domain-containing protein [Streptomyces sp. PU-14G]|uniref:DUF6011 domain-containing protein n=1 Tax=Streptomyces sp. PU-14G TaxID=2800808 RepID=UPI0034DF7985